MFRPFHYYVVDKVTKKTGRIWSIRTQMGGKKQWKGKYFEGEVEKDALMKLVTSKDLAPPHAKSKQHLIAPIQNHRLMMPTKDRRERYPKTDEFWKRCNQEFDRLKTDGATGLLEENYGFPESLATQLDFRNRGKVKVAYNSSGTRLKAARVSCKTIVASTCYWLICESVQEAQFLVGVINAPNMQETWRLTKTSKMHYHTAPLKSIPVPKFEPNSDAHNRIVSVVDRLEKEEITELEDLNAPVARLLPKYVSSG